MKLFQYHNLFSWHMSIFVVFWSFYHNFAHQFFAWHMYAFFLYSIFTSFLFSPPYFHLLSYSSSSFNLQSFLHPAFIFIFFLLAWKIVHSFLGWKVTFVDALIFFGWNLFFLQPALKLQLWLFLVKSFNLTFFFCCFNLLCILLFWSCKV